MAITTVRIAHYYLVAKKLNCKPQTELRWILVYFLHYSTAHLQYCTLSYVWCWILLALWVALRAVHWRSRQVPAVERVCTLTGPPHLTKHRGLQWSFMA